MTTYRREEKALLNTIRAQLSVGDTRLFRQQSGEYWIGEVTHLRDGSIRIENPIRVVVGFPGLADLGGWRSVVVTPEMVGQRIAVYVALEVKTPRGRVKDDQQRFIHAVNEAGGIGSVVRSVADAVDALTGVDK